MVKTGLFEAIDSFIPLDEDLATFRVRAWPNVNTSRANVNSVKSNVNSIRHNANFVRTNVNIGRSKQPIPTSNSNSFSPVRPQDHQLKNMEDRESYIRQNFRGGRYSPTTLEAAKTLSKVDSQRSKSVDKGKRYKRRKESKGKDIDTGFEDISTGFKDISTGFKEISTSFEDISTGFEEVNTCGLGVSTEEASLVEAIRLQTLEEEETAKQVQLDALLAKRIEEQELTEQQKKRKAQGKSCQKKTLQRKWRKKFFAEERAKARRSKPMTQSQLRNYMINYLKNQGTWKLTQLKKLSFEEVKEEFDKLVKQVESFVLINIKATKAQLKRYGEELQTKISKKQRIDVLDTEKKVVK
ncbi:hypothetical protein Tco_0802986 [Tanacetum coccineum]|uniref:Uncharacterized protein n=1 Tax=Tanacetum coccineum TaxID=301880 RepID=A0ABQ5A4L5_9ASTR